MGVPGLTYESRERWKGAECEHLVLQHHSVLGIGCAQQCCLEVDRKSPLRLRVRLVPNNLASVCAAYHSFRNRKIDKKEIELYKDVI